MLYTNQYITEKTFVPPVCPFFFRIVAKTINKKRKQAMLESMQQLLGEVRSSEAQKREAAAKLRAEIEAATNRIEGGPGWTPEQEV